MPNSAEMEIARFNATLARYEVVSKKSLDEVLEKKGRDLGIRLFKGFSDHKFGGPGKKRAGLAGLELKARTESGEGTKVRASLMQRYLAARGELRERHRADRQSELSGLGSIAGGMTANSYERLNLWRSVVGQEIKTRQSGIGVLAASFLWFRARSSQAKGIYYMRNRTGKPLGFVDKGEGFLRIVGLTDGLTKTDAKYNIVAGALSGASDDMLEYLRTRERENFAAVFGAAA